MHAATYSALSCRQHLPKLHMLLSVMRVHAFVMRQHAQSMLMLLCSLSLLCLYALRLCKCQCACFRRMASGSSQAYANEQPDHWHRPCTHTGHQGLQNPSWRHHYTEVTPGEVSYTALPVRDVKCIGHRCSALQAHDRLHSVCRLLLWSSDSRPQSQL